MAKLKNISQDKDLISQLQVADTLMTRTRGLIGTKSLGPQQGLWIKRCRAIHTFFMSMPIDVVYLDQKLEVQKLQKNAKPWRSFMPVLSASSVIELAHGRISELGIQKGDQLYVGD